MSAAPRSPQAEIQPKLELRGASDVVVEYSGDDPVLLRSAGGDRLLTFSPARRARAVPARDAVKLLRNPLFRRAEQ